MAYTPWGQSDYSRKIACGIISYSTPRHGGIHVSPDRLKTMPDYLRNDSGWYEEDCEWCKVAIAFPEYFQKEIESAKETLKHWLPDEYERHFNVKLQPGESHTRDEQLFNIANVNNYIVTCAWGDWKEDIPKGMVGVAAHKQSDDTIKYFLVDESRYTQPYVINLLLDKEIPEIK